VKFYCVIRSLEDKRFPKNCYKQLKDACIKRGVEFIPVEAQKIDLTNLPRLGNKDILYRITSDETSHIVAASLLTPEVATFYIDNLQGSLYYTTNWSHTIGHKMHGLPIIPTIADLPNDRELLKKYVKYLGGFPVILKAQGGSHGIGVIKVDSPESLFSIVDYLVSMAKSNVALRKYIDYSTHARLIVIGNKVVDSIEYKRAGGDFRSNIGNSPEVVPRKFSTAIEKAAIKATHIKGYECGGVDILIDKDGVKFYIAEVNYPCNFSRCQNLTGVDIAGKMVDHLLNKTQKPKARTQ
jgi:hypothetical protein